MHYPSHASLSGLSSLPYVCTSSPPTLPTLCFPLRFNIFSLSSSNISSPLFFENSSCVHFPPARSSSTPGPRMRRVFNLPRVLTLPHRPPYPRVRRALLCGHRVSCCSTRLPLLPQVVDYGNWRTEGAGRTALHLATRGGHVDIIAALLAKKADIEARDQVVPQSSFLAGLAGPSAPPTSASDIAAALCVRAESAPRLAVAACARVAVLSQHLPAYSIHCGILLVGWVHGA